MQAVGGERLVDDVGFLGFFGQAGAIAFSSTRFSVEFAGAAIKQFFGFGFYGSGSALVAHTMFGQGGVEVAVDDRSVNSLVRGEGLRVAEQIQLGVRFVRAVLEPIQKTHWRLSCLVW